MNKEKLIARIMEECAKDGEPVTREEAEEMAEMEIKSGGVKNYTQSEVEKKPRKKREVKKDETKLSFIDTLASWLVAETAVSNIQIVNAQREVSFEIGQDSYSLVLTKHRKK